MLEEVSIIPARTPEDLHATLQLFEAYAASLDIDLCFQDFSTELIELPGKYAPPRGEILLAKLGDKIMGCVAVRPLKTVSGAESKAASTTCCEMKRLYLSPEGRGLGIGEILVAAILQEAKQMGYAEMRLDTLSTMKPAIALYEKFGFVPMDAYYDTPIPNTLFFRCYL